jgi:hypothetical protein
MQEFEDHFEERLQDSMCNMLVVLVHGVLVHGVLVHGVLVHGVLGMPYWLCLHDVCTIS